MLACPVEFGGKIDLSDTTQYFRALGNAAASISLFVVVMHLPGVDNNPDMFSELKVAFFLILWSLPAIVVTSIFFKYFGEKDAPIQGAIAFCANWMSCIVLVGSLALSSLSTLSMLWFLNIWLILFDRKQIEAFVVVLPFTALTFYTLFVLPSKWIEGMVGSNELTGGSKAFYAVNCFLIIWPIGKIVDHSGLIDQIVSPIFEALP